MLYLSLSARQRRIFNVEIGGRLLVSVESREGESDLLRQRCIAVVEQHPQSGSAMYRYEASSQAVAMWRQRSGDVTDHVLQGQQILSAGRRVRNLQRSDVELKDARGYTVRTNASYISEGHEGMQSCHTIVRVLWTANGNRRPVRNEHAQEMRRIEQDLVDRQTEAARVERQEMADRRAALARQRRAVERRDRRVLARTTEDIASPMPVGSWIEGEDEGDVRWYETANRNTSARRATL